MSQINTLIKQVLGTIDGDTSRTTKTSSMYMQQVMTFYLKDVVAKAAESADSANRKTITVDDIIKVLSDIECMEDLLPKSVMDSFKVDKMETDPQ